MDITRAGPADKGGFERVFGFLREQLLTGVIQPGDRLMAERELAVRLGVSRPSLREALRALAVLGVVETRHGAGTVVRRPGVSVLGDLFAFAAARSGAVADDVVQARIAIECQAIRLACVRATASDVDRLGAALLRIGETIDDPEAGGAADHAFHAGIVAAAGSETLVTLYGAIEALLVRSHRDRRQSIAGLVDGRAYLIDHHRLIFDAVIDGDPRGADELLREHFAIGDAYRRRLAGGPLPCPTEVSA